MYPRERAPNLSRSRDRTRARNQQLCARAVRTRLGWLASAVVAAQCHTSDRDGSAGFCGVLWVFYAWHDHENTCVHTYNLPTEYKSISSIVADALRIEISRNEEALAYGDECGSHAPDSLTIFFLLAFNTKSSVIDFAHLCLRTRETQILRPSMYALWNMRPDNLIGKQTTY